MDPEIVFTYVITCIYKTITFIETEAMKMRETVRKGNGGPGNQRGRG